MDTGGLGPYFKGFKPIGVFFLHLDAQEESMEVEIECITDRFSAVTKGKIYIGQLNGDRISFKGDPGYDNCSWNFKNHPDWFKIISKIQPDKNYIWESLKTAAQR